jgi:hypothetical protein
MTVWCKDNNLSLNVIKTKEMIVDYRKRRAEHVPILIDRADVEQVKFLSIHITNKHQNSCEESTTKPIPPRRLKKFGMCPQIFKRFYSCTIKSILTGCITAWYGNCSASNRKAL